jgi:hypothetical protein
MGYSLRIKETKEGWVLLGKSFVHTIKMGYYSLRIKETKEEYVLLGKSFVHTTKMGYSLRT